MAGMWYLLVALLPLAASLMVKNVPYHRQITEFSCGDATMEMLLHWSGMDVDQRAIMDVMRTSSYEGTLSFDMKRALHFSSMSKSPPQGLYPAYAPDNGWQGRFYGLAAYQRRDTQCWVEELVQTLDAGYPVGVLMHYSDPQAHDGHFRVVIGHDEANKTITMLDPWDRTQLTHQQFVRSRPHSRLARESTQNSVSNGMDGKSGEGEQALQPRVFVVSRDEFCALWNYREQNFNTTYDPYFAVVGSPFQIALEFYENSTNNTLDIVAQITYPLPAAFLSDTPDFDAVSTVAEISLPPSLVLASGTPQAQIGLLRPGATATVRWSTLSDDSQPKSTVRTFITVTSYGVVSGDVPDMSWSSNATRPGYHYRDYIGGQAQLEY